MDNNIELREINKLIKESFYIPTYQRGYRWDSQQVIDLLEDVYEFMGKANVQNGEFYCLQPIVVKKMDDGGYEVIDGQQRLTTIMIILKYLGKNTFSIKYESRSDSEDFLNDIVKKAAEEGEEKYKFIDYYFMFNAYLKIKDWFENNIKKNEEESLKDEFSFYLLKYCRVIWYEINDEDSPESVFTRLNIGKIPLTNAELIKALFLRKSNFADGGAVADLCQLEIASEWDTIENSLQDPKMWYFINPKYAEPLETRIEYIFDTIAGKTEKDGENYTFIHYAKEFENGKEIKVIWKNVKDHYRILREWYEDQELYHLIGFLTSSGSQVSIAELITEYFAKEYKKNEFIDLISGKIKDYFAGHKIDNMSYKDNADKQYINDILLLFNVITVKNKSSAYSKFPFDSYNEKQWSLEHIHAQNAEGLGNKKELWNSWIDEHINSFREFSDDKYKAVVRKLESVDRENLTSVGFEDLFDEICTMIQDDYGVDLHSISNMALLDRDSNSAIGNNFFDVKREKVINLDRDGIFIPVCTRNVFLKYYSKDPSQIHYWSESDRNDYLEKIKTILRDYIEVEGEENE